MSSTKKQRITNSNILVPKTLRSPEYRNLYLTKSWKKRFSIFWLLWKIIRSDLFLCFYNLRVHVINLFVCTHTLSMRYPPVSSLFAVWILSSEGLLYQEASVSYGFPNHRFWIFSEIIIIILFYYYFIYYLFICHFVYFYYYYIYYLFICHFVYFYYYYIYYLFICHFVYFYYYFIYYLFICHFVYFYYYYICHHLFNPFFYWLPYFIILIYQFFLLLNDLFNWYSTWIYQKWTLQFQN